MTIKLPDLSQASCRHLIFCGVLDDEEKTPIQWVKKNAKVEIARTKSHGYNVYTRAILGKTPVDGHCHLDIAMKDYFGNGEPPKASTTWAEMQRLFDPLIGTKLVVEYEGVFAIPCEKLPTVVKLAGLFDVTQGGVGIKLTGGRLSVTGAPIYAITWCADDDDETNALVRLEARLEVRLDENCMLAAFDLLRNGFQSFIESGVFRAE